MRIKGILDESFVDYKKPSMYIAFPYCTFKCDTLNKKSVCQNCSLVKEPTLDIEKEVLIERYLDNPITQAIVLSGLEPLDSMIEVTSFVTAVRDKYHCDDDIIIYTGYTQEEVEAGLYGGLSPNLGINQYNFLKNFPNIYFKFGRFILGEEQHYDEVLGINLASSNQYGVKISNE
jgi:hypothetical protein